MAMLFRVGIVDDHAHNVLLPQVQRWAERLTREEVLRVVQLEPILELPEVLLARLDLDDTSAECRMADDERTLPYDRWPLPGVVDDAVDLLRPLLLRRQIRVGVVRIERAVQ